MYHGTVNSVSGFALVLRDYLHKSDFLYFLIFVHT